MKHQRRQWTDVESPIQRAVLEYLWRVLPQGSLVVHVPNGNRLAGKGAARAVSKEKWLGMLPGFPDLMALLPDGQALFFEVKSPSGTVEAHQADIHERLRALGFHVAVVRGIDAVTIALNEWGVQTREAAR